MDYNTMLLRLGLNSTDFVNKVNEPIKTSTGFIYEVEQVVHNRTCPNCKSQNCYINSYRFIEISYWSL